MSFDQNKIIAESEKMGVKYKWVAKGNDVAFNYLMTSFSWWENDTFRVFDFYKDKEKVALDIGSWIGATPIWLAKNYKHVVCVDADERAMSALKLNLHASSCNNVSFVENPLSPTKGKVIFGSNTLRSVGPADSMSQIKDVLTDSNDKELETITLEELMAKVDEVGTLGLIKVDIEGGEENLITSLLELARNRKVPLYLSFHLTMWKNNDIHRFAPLFREWPSIQLKPGRIVRDPCAFLALNPLGSLL